MHIGWPNVAGVQGPGPACHQINQFERLLGLGSSAIVSAGEYSVPTVSLMWSASFGWRPPILPVSLPLPLFATHPVTHSSSVATQKYSSWPGSRSSTPCLDLAVFDSESLGLVSLDSPVSAVVMWDAVNPLELGEVNVLGMAATTSRFSPLIPRRSPASSIPHIHVDSPTSYEEPVGFKDECPAADRGRAASPSRVSGVVGAVVAQPGVGGL